MWTPGVGINGDKLENTINDLGNFMCYKYAKDSNFSATYSWQGSFETEGKYFRDTKIQQDLESTCLEYETAGSRCPANRILHKPNFLFHKVYH